MEAALAKGGEKFERKSSVKRGGGGEGCLEKQEYAAMMFRSPMMGLKGLGLSKKLSAMCTPRTWPAKLLCGH